jgi:hypothetical protein
LQSLQKHSIDFAPANNFSLEAIMEQRLPIVDLLLELLLKLFLIIIIELLLKLEEEVIVQLLLCQSNEGVLFGVEPEDIPQLVDTDLLLRWRHIVERNLPLVGLVKDLAGGRDACRAFTAVAWSFNLLFLAWLLFGYLILSELVDFLFNFLLFILLHPLRVLVIKLFKLVFHMVQDFLVVRAHGRLVSA